MNPPPNLPPVGRSHKKCQIAQSGLAIFIERETSQFKVPSLFGEGLGMGI